MSSQVTPYVSLGLAAITVIILSTTLLIITTGQSSFHPVKTIIVKTPPSPTPDISQLYQTGTQIKNLTVISVSPHDAEGTVTFRGHTTISGIFKFPNCIEKFDAAVIPRITAVSDPTLCLIRPKTVGTILSGRQLGQPITVVIDDLSINASDGNSTATLINVLK